MYPNYPPTAPAGLGFQPPNQNQPGQPGYPPVSGFNQPGPGYPPSPYPPAGGAPGYPIHTPGYQHPTTGYPTVLQNPGYPATSAPPAYPPTSGIPSYPPAPGYPQATPGYPAPAGYPPAVSAAGYPVQPGYGAPAGPTPAYPGQGQPATYSQHPINPSYGAPGAPAGAGRGVQMQQYQEIPTIRDGPFDPSGDAQILRKAMKGLGTDEKAIINVLGRRTNSQRQQIAMAFKTSFGKDLIKDLKSELGGRLEDVVLALMTPKFEYMAKTLHKAMSGIGTKESVLVDILCTASNDEMRQLNYTYQQMYKRTVEQDLKGDTSGHFRRLLVSMSVAGRNENPMADSAMATADAQNLLQAGEKKWGTDESAFNMVLATRSYAQLRLMFHEYERITGHGLERAISNEFSGDVKDGMMAVVKCAKNRAAYFAERLHESMAGFGTKDDDLVFLLVTRAEIDLENIKQEYQRMYNKSLSSAVSNDTSGDYKKILLAVIG